MGRTSRAFPFFVLHAYLDESVEHHVRVERVAALPRGLDDRVDVLVPEDAVGRVNLRDVAEQPLGVDLAQDRAALQVQQAVQEQLQWNIPSFRFPFPPGLTRQGRRRTSKQQKFHGRRLQYSLYIFHPLVMLLP